MMLELEDESGYIYISKEPYDQATILNDRYECDYELILKKLVDSTPHKEAIDFYYENAPEPVSMLAPYLALIREDIKLELSMECLTGVLHQLSQVISFSEFIKVPKEVRADVNFSKVFINKFKTSWETLESKLTVTEVDIENIRFSAIEALLRRIADAGGLAINANTSSSSKSEKSATKVEEDPLQGKTIDDVEDEEDLDDFWNSLAQSVNNAMDKAKEEVAEKVKDEKSSAPAATPTPTATTSTVTANDIASQSIKADDSVETVDKKKEEADKIANLISKFGGNM